MPIKGNPFPEQELFGVAACSGGQALALSCGQNEGPGTDGNSCHAVLAKKNRQESNDKPGSVRAGARDRHSSRRAVACPLKQPTRKVWPGQPPSLFGLAPDGVCRACRVTTASGGLLLHRFTLTRPVRDRPGGLLSVALSEGRPSWTLSSVLPCGARTFLSGPMPAAAICPAPAC